MKRFLRPIYNFLIEIIRINIIKTIYANIKLFPIKDAFKFSILIYGPCDLKIKGDIRIHVPVRKGLLKIGHKFEILTYKTPCRFHLFGTLSLRGEVWFGTATNIYIGKNGVFEIGDLSTIGSCSRIVCQKSIIFSEYTQFGAWANVSDSNYHYMEDLISGKVHRKEREIFIGSRNWLGTQVTLLPGTKTPNNLIIALGTICNRDYTKDIPENSIIAGIPAKLVKENIMRIFDQKSEIAIDEYFRGTDSEFILQ